MWIPRTLSDLEGALQVVSESSDLDFKREVGSPREVAKDIASMTVFGGVIVFGVDEIDGTASGLQPFKLHGAVGRIQQIADTRIRPTAPIDLFAINGERAGEGFIVGVVDASPLAPHWADDA